MRAEILLKTDEKALLLEAQPHGKLRVNAAAWTDPKVFLPDQVLKVRWNAGQLHLIRRHRVADPAVDPQPYHFDYVSDEPAAERDE